MGEVRSSHRGVWCISPGHGASKVLLAYDRNDKLIVPPVVVPDGTDVEEVGAELWRILNIEDPGPSIIGALPPSFRKLDRRLRDRSHLKAI